MAIVENPRYEDAYIAVNAYIEADFKDQFKGMLYYALAEGIVERLGELVAENDFPDHKGRPGEVGGSLPKDNNINMPQNLKIEDLNTVEYSNENILNFTEKGSVRKYYLENIKGQEIIHPDKRLGKVTFEDDGISESIDINRPKNFFIIAKVIELVKNSKYDREELANKHERQDDIVKFHIVYTKAKLPNKIRILQIKIAENSNGKKYYFLRPIMTIKNSLSLAIAKEVKNDNSSLQETEANIIIIPYLETNLNPNVKELCPEIKTKNYAGLFLGHLDNVN